MELARAAGFHRAGIVDPRLLETRPHAATPDAGMEWEWIQAPSGWSASSAILVCCLSCLRREPDDLGLPGDPHARVAPFARAHYYREAVRMLNGVTCRLEQEAAIPHASVRLFSNSRIPEKPLLVAAGLAAYGRNGCAIVPGLGSMFVIAGAVLPVPTRREPTVEPLPDPCGPCRACQAACPAHAIDQPYIVRRDLCLQALASSAGPLEPRTMALWGARLYGCQECQAACPHNRGLDSIARPATGEIGPSVALRDFLSESDAQRRSRLRGTALGMSWLPQALLRNALIAAGSRGDPAVRAEVERFTGPQTAEPVRTAARWARERL